MVLSIADLFNLQDQLQSLHPEWEPIEPSTGKDHLLFAIGEIGEVIEIVKKLGDDAVVNDPTVRAHFIEEISDVIMYLTDVLMCYGVKPEEYSAIHLAKSERNRTRNYIAEHDHIFDDKK